MDENMPASSLDRFASKNGRFTPSYHVFDRSLDRGSRRVTAENRWFIAPEIAGRRHK
jgi:hypothetical protein